MIGGTPIRFVFLGSSIVSDWRNPQATTSRAVLRSLRELGYEAVFLEPRRNSPTVGLLAQRGASPVRAFNEAWSDLQYRTVDLPSRREVGVWIGQFAATADVVVALEGTPEGILRGLHEFSSDRLIVLIEAPADGLGDWGTTTLRPVGGADEFVRFRPAVETCKVGNNRKSRLVVAYDDADLAIEVSERLEGWERIVAGSADLPAWKFVAESDLLDRYRRASEVVVIDNADRPFAPARVLLARACGCVAVGIVRTTGERSDVPAVAIDEFEPNLMPQAIHLDGHLLGLNVATELVRVARNRLEQRRDAKGWRLGTRAP